MKCPNCGQSLWFCKSFCPFCKQPITQPGATPTPIPAAPAPLEAAATLLASCPYCGKDNRDKVQTCPGCGTSLVAEASDSPEPTRGFGAGRLDRVGFAIKYIGGNLIALFLVMLCEAVDVVIVRVLALPVSIINLILVLHWTIQRLHDVGRPTSHVGFLFIPIFNLGFLIYLFFKRGVPGANRYGADPLVTN